MSEAARQRGCKLLLAGRPTLDLLDPQSISRVVDAAAPDVIINTAAYTAVDQAENEPERAFAINADGVAYLAKTCARSNVALIHISTDYVFDGNARTPYTEGDLANPINTYGRSKLAGEERLREVLERHIILRTAWLFGAFDSNFLKTMLRLAGERPSLSIVNDQTGNPTYAAHLAEIILPLAENIAAGREQPWGTYHACAAGEATWFEFAREIFLTRVIGGLRCQSSLR